MKSLIQALSCKEPQPAFAMQPGSHYLRHRLSAIAAGTALACLLAAPAVQAQAQQHTKLEDPIPAKIEPSPIKIALQPVLSGLVSPVVATTAPGDRDHLYVADQVGQVWRLQVNDDDRLKVNDDDRRHSRSELNCSST